MAKQSNKTDVEFIKALAELLSENNLTELEVKREYGEADQLNVRVSRQSQIVQATTIAAPVAATAPAAPAAAPAPAPSTANAAAAPEADTSEDPASHPGAVTSPMVGTVYMQMEPGSPPFVKVGQSVSEGDTVMIIEAMKTMNHIPAPKSGTVKRILVGDGDPVEFGAPLLILE